MATERRKSKINTWKPKEEDIIVTSDGKLFILFFDKLFGKPNLKVLNRFFIKKGSYENQLEVITKCINFFIKFYDSDNELCSAYFKLKYALDKEKRFTKDNTDELIDMIYEIMMTPSMVEKITTMVEENYLDDIENTDDKKKYSSKENKHLESLEFTNQHIKILLKISFGMKIISPILFHYVSLNVIKLDKNSDMIYRFYIRLFELFGDGVNMYNKLFVYVKAKVLESKGHNELIFDQRDILGVDEYTVIHSFVKKVLISENIVKYKFNEIWDAKQKKYKENIIGFNKTIIKYQLIYFIKDQYSKNLAEVTNTKNSDGLSGIDKMSMNLQKLDEGIINLADINIATGIERIKKMLDIEVSEEEVEYYRKHHVPHKLQIQLINSFYAKYLGGYRDLNLVTRKEYITLMLILKKKLLIESGCDSDEEGVEETAKLPYILSGNVMEKVNNRIIRNNKFLSKIEESYLYKNLTEKKYKLLHELKPDYILSLLSTLINTTFTYVTYEDPSLLGKEIECTDDKISDELLFFLNNI